LAAGNGAAVNVFRLGLVGAGRMGRNHMRALAGNPHVQVTAVADPSESAREDLRSDTVTVHADLNDMLRAAQVDGVLVAAPSPLHVGLIDQLTAAGVPILSEKPCGLTSADARRAESLAARRGVKLQVAYWRRFVPALKQLRARIAAGDIGGLYLVACYQWDEQPPPAAFRTGSGGIFIDMGVHEFDQIRWLTGQEITSIHACSSTATSEPPVAGDTESAQALCALSGGGTAIVSLGRRFPGGDICRVEVFGTRDVEDCRFLWPPTSDETFLQALKDQAESFVAWTRGTPGEGASAEDAVAALQSAERASQTLQGG
jgi:myo-inositol 2-dehydrogenase/D-chiro-inositol 1-dehydrogenase